MLEVLLVPLIGAALTAAAALWILRAYRAEGGGARAALIACGLGGVAALGLYIAIGRPALADAPFDERLAALRTRDPSTYNADEALAVMAAAARARPSDPLPHFYSGEVLYATARYEEAAREYDAALRRNPGSPQALLGLGRAMVALEGGRVSDDALAVFAQAGALSDDPAPWIYQAMAAMQQERAEDVRRLWGEAYARMREDDPRREMARRMSAGETP